MRILRVAQNVYPSVTGGGAYHVHAMSRDQTVAGHDVTVVTVAQEGESPGIEEQGGYTIVRCRAPLELLGNTISPGVAHYLRRVSEYDIIHAHSHLYFSTNVATLGSTFSETPLTLTNHGLYSQSVPEWLFNGYLRTVGKWIFNAADIVFCYSETDRDRLRDLGVDSNISVVANGIDVTRFSPDGPVSDDVDTDTPALLFVGRLTEGKRPADAIQALARVRENHPDAHLYVAGDGESRETLEALVTDCALGDAVTFLGHVDYDEMPRLYRAANVLVLPSRAEGMPRTVLEALATETPVVTSDLPQLRSLTDAAGHAVPIGDIEALAAALTTVLSDPEKARTMGTKGRKMVTDRYTWAETVRETTERLTTLVET